MRITRRQCGIAIATLTVGACARSIPTEPSIPELPSSLYGNLYKSGFAGIEGTLAQVLAAARLNPDINNVGLMTALDGRLPLLPSTGNPGYLFHVRGIWFGNGIREIALKPGEQWDLFDWNGKNPPGNLTRYQLPMFYVRT